MYTTHSEADLSLQHLQAELERLHHLIHRQVRLWQLADQDPADRLRGLYLSSEIVPGVHQRPLPGQANPCKRYRQVRAY